MADDGESPRRCGGLASRREVREIGANDRLDRLHVERVGIPADGRRLEEPQVTGSVGVRRRGAVRLRVGGQRPGVGEPAGRTRGHRARVRDESERRERPQCRVVRELATSPEGRRPGELVVGHEAQ